MPRRSRADLLALEQISADQNRCISLDQLASCEVPSSTIAHRTRPERGSWSRILPGVVLLHRGTPTPDERASAALLFAGDGAVLTGLEALRRHGSRRLPPDPAIHVLVPHARRPTSYGFVVIERTRRLPVVAGPSRLPVAPVPRALVDAARHLGLVATRAAIAEAVQSRRCRTDDLMDELRQAQRRGTARSRLVAAEMIAGVRSVAEARFRHFVQRAGLPSPLWNHDLVTPDGEFVGCPDAWWPEGLAAEVDSREFHLDPAGWERTQSRRARFARFGVQSIPITPSRILGDQSRLAADLWGALEAARSGPRPVLHAVMRSQSAD